MKEFLAVVKHEYKKIVLKWTFLLATLLFPVLGAAFAIVPALIFSIKGEPTRLVIVDQTGKIAPRLKENLSKGKTTTKPVESREEQMKNVAGQAGETFNFIEYGADAKSNEQIKRELTGKITNKEIESETSRASEGKQTASEGKAKTSLRQVH